MRRCGRPTARRRLPRSAGRQLERTGRSARVVLGDLLSHWLRRALAGIRAAGGAVAHRRSPAAERGAATVAHTTRTKSHHYQWRAAGMGWIAPSNLSVAIHGLKSKPADRSGPDNEVGGEWAHSHATVADATRTEFPPLLWKYSVGAVNAPGQSANPEINGSGAREIVNRRARLSRAGVRRPPRPAGSAYQAGAREERGGARRRAVWPGLRGRHAGAARSRDRAACPTPSFSAATPTRGPSRAATPRAFATTLRTWRASGTALSLTAGTTGGGTAARGYRGGTARRCLCWRYAPSEGGVRPAVAAAAARSARWRRSAPAMCRRCRCSTRAASGARCGGAGDAAGECDALHGDLRRLFWEDAGAPPESGLAEVVAEETLAAAVTATLSVVAAAADIEGRAPPMRHRFARRDNYTLVWSWA